LAGSACTIVIFGCGTPEAIEYGDGSTNGGTESGGDEESVCGDGVVEGGEDCDDGNDVDVDACHDDCTIPGRTLWRTELGGPGPVEIVFAQGRLYLSGGTGYQGSDHWMAAVDLDGKVVEFEAYPETVITGLTAVSDDRLLWGQDIGPYSATPVDICVRDIGGVAQCEQPSWQGDPVYLNLMSRGFGRVGSVSTDSAKVRVHEFDAQGDVSRLMVFQGPSFIENVIHQFTPTGHVVYTAYADTTKLQWIDDEGSGTALLELGEGALLWHAPLAVADDGSVAVYDSAAFDGDVSQLVVANSDGTLRWTMPYEPLVTGLLFAPNGDLFVLERSNGPGDTLTRYSAGGTARWSRTWPGIDTLSTMAWGPDDILYLGGAGAWDDPSGQVAVVRAVRP
jgi:cysteine-rich repeat protein